MSGVRIANTVQQMKKRKKKQMKKRSGTWTA